MTFFNVFAGVFGLSKNDGSQLLPVPLKSGSCLATPEGLLDLILSLLVSEGIFHCIMYVPSPETLKKQQFAHKSLGLVPMAFPEMGPASLAELPATQR